ncbi:hypothetical protein VAE308_1360004 [Vibrio aestuarianus]|nr:hypothetical protein [Vibrio aestuarianus subsp. francensis]CAH8229023.1 hypothetical protein VAE308_1360004 [Vibrio aestuarianus]
MAFLVFGKFSDLGGLRKVGLGGTHPLTRRYVLDEFLRSKLRFH